MYMYVNVWLLERGLVTCNDIAVTEHSHAWF